MSSEEKDERTTITIKVKLPTKETVVEAISKLFPGIEVEVEEKGTSEETPP